MKKFLPAIIIAAIALLLGGVFGYLTTPTIGGIVTGVISVAVLSLMEAAESMDNAVVDARILKGMSETWQKRYLTLGMPIAVLGMRFLFPVIIVSIIATITPWDAVTLAFSNPHHYAEIMSSAKNNISAFGGAFLLMIALSFFFDEEKDSHWIAPLEKLASKMGGISNVVAGLTVLALLVTDLFVPGMKAKFFFLVWGMVGIASYTLIKETMGWLVGDGTGTAIARSGGLLTFLYLEFIDGSFSFDSVISAFAISTDPIIIAIGLGVGAYVVRCMTLSLVKNNTLSEYEFVEHGAFYTILILSILMLVSVVKDIPEWLTGSIGIVLIGGSFIASIIKNKKNA